MCYEFVKFDVLQIQHWVSKLGFFSYSISDDSRFVNMINDILDGDVSDYSSISLAPSVIVLTYLPLAFILLPIYVLLNWTFVYFVSAKLT